MVYEDEKCYFLSFNTDSRIGLCTRSRYLRYVDGNKAIQKHFSISKFLPWLEK